MVSMIGSMGKQPCLALHRGQVASGHWNNSNSELGIPLLCRVSLGKARRILAVNQYEPKV